MQQLLMILFLLALNTALAGEKFNFVHTKINDKSVCVFSETKGDASGPESCTFVCDSPSKEIKTKLLSCYDTEVLNLIVKGKSHSTQNSMMRLGGFAGLGNKNGIVEWIKEGDRVVGLIVRFEGSQVDTDGKTLKPKSELAVFDFRNDKVCWKGNFVDNLKAREAFEKAACLELIPGE